MPEIDRDGHAALRDALTTASDQAWALFEHYEYPKLLFLAIGHIQNALKDLAAYEKVLDFDGDAHWMLKKLGRDHA